VGVKLVLRTFQNNDRLWSIERRGKTLTIRHGKAAGKQQVSQRKLFNDYLAERELRKLVREKQTAGYRETTPPGAMPELDATGRALEQAVVDNPDDRAAHMAFADWLSEQPDDKLQRWGEFIRVQLALEDADLPADERKKLDRRARESQEANQRDWLGEPLARLLLHLDLSILPRSLHEDTPLFEWKFRRGWLDSLFVSYLNAAVAEVLAGSPSLRLLRELILAETPRRGEPFAPFAGTRNLGNVRLLSLEDHFAASPAPLVGSLPRLGELQVTMGGNCRGLLRLPNLANLHTLALAGLDDYPLDELAARTDLARLRRLYFNGLERGGMEVDYDPRLISLAEVARALHPQRLPALKELTVNLFDDGDEGCELLVESGLLKQLEVLDLREGDIDALGADALTECPDLPRLKQLVLRGNDVGRAALRRLRRTGVSLGGRGAPT
jgi:uncharacterized protein (TIGR02996 family)